ncbi:MAG: NAD-dependent epimerase/dehydratase family protein [Candidatus Thermoplasmatota archaeon]|nr:NAD-dependent epimerase/dehydratase family protein [Candidatus Thermoplasmatota archaeon]
MGRMLITGGAGFIGSNLAKIAREMGWKVTILDNLSSSLDTNLIQLESLGIEVIIGDIRVQSILNKCLLGITTVVHLAAQVSVPMSVKNPEETMHINVKGTQNVIDSCLENGVKRLVVASSAAVYGEADSLPLNEDAAGQLLSPYAESKWANEQQIVEARSNGLEASCLRFFNVYGIGQRPDGAYASVIPKFIDMMAKGIQPSINGDGGQTRDFVHVDDVCNAIITLVEGDWKANSPHVYNVATQTRISLLDLVSIINKSLANKIENYSHLAPIHDLERPGDIRHSMASISRIKQVLNWQPSIGFQEGIDDLVSERLSML